MHEKVTMPESCVRLLGEMGQERDAFGSGKVVAHEFPKNMGMPTSCHGNYYQKLREVPWYMYHHEIDIVCYTDLEV